MEILDELKSKLDKKWIELQNEWNDIEEKGNNPFDQWSDFLDKLGLVDFVFYEMNWSKDCGIPHLLDNFYKIINGDDSVYAVDFYDGNSNQVLLFDREKLNKAIKEYLHESI